MITKRIIPCLDVKDGRVVKGVNFEGLNDVSSPVSLAKYYSDNGADELVFYDITASSDGRKLFTDILLEVAKTIPKTSTIMPPAVPVRLIIALAFERSGFTVTSGIRATAGERKIAIEIKTTRRVAINPIRGHGFSKVSLSVCSLTNCIAASSDLFASSGIDLAITLDN